MRLLLSWIGLTLLLTLSLSAKLNLVVSILPQQKFVEAIGGEHVDVTLMVLPGNSPHTYEPKPSQMRAIAHASLYLAIGVEYEKVWLSRFQDLNPQLKIIDLTQGITKYPIASHTHPSTADQRQETTLDPHIWTAPSNLKRIAGTILATLQHYDPTHRADYQANFEQFIEKIEQTDQHIKTLLASTPKGAKFMVFHPSWGYFAKQYGLTQLPIEIAGKSPKPKALIALIKEAKAEQVTAIFTQPEFPDRSAKLLANALHIPVIKLTPLSPNWSQTLIKMADAIAQHP